MGPTDDPPGRAASGKRRANLMVPSLNFPTAVADAPGWAAIGAPWGETGPTCLNMIKIRA